MTSPVVCAEEWLLESEQQSINEAIAVLGRYLEYPVRKHLFDRVTKNSEELKKINLFLHMYGDAYLNVGFGLTDSYKALQFFLKEAQFKKLPHLSMIKNDIRIVGDAAIQSLQKSEEYFQESLILDEVGEPWVDLFTRLKVIGALVKIEWELDVLIPRHNAYKFHLR